jgi:hypothetical protein
MAPLDTGRYIITNAKHRNVVFLPDANEGSDVVGSDQKDDPGEMVRNTISIANVSPTSHPLTQWNIDLLSNTNYIIQNYGYGSLANSETHVEVSPDDIVVGGNARQQWKIIESFQGTYWSAFSAILVYISIFDVLGERICPTSHTNVCWSLDNDEEHCPVRDGPSTLRSVTRYSHMSSQIVFAPCNSSRKNTWSFTRVPDEGLTGVPHSTHVYSFQMHGTSFRALSFSLRGG